MKGVDIGRLNSDGERLALAVIGYVSDNMSVIRRGEFEDWLDAVGTDGLRFAREFSSEHYDCGTYRTERTWYNNRSVGVDRFRYIGLHTFRSGLTRDAGARLYVVPLRASETVVFDSNPLPVETSVNDYLAEVLHVKSGVARVELSIYHNACDRNLTYNCTRVCFNLDPHLLSDAYDGVEYCKHESPHIAKENYQYF